LPLFRLTEILPGLIQGIWTGKTAYEKFHGVDTVKWEPNDGGFAEHVISTSSEWLAAALLMLVLGSFLPDFRHINLHQPVIRDPRVVERYLRESV
jgi:hypothetical protein